MNDSLGARLRRERERRHLTLAQIASATKIQVLLFEGLERDDVSRWPAGIFRRSFIRAYAEMIGLDPAAVCREFIERHPEPGNASPAVPPPEPAVASESPRTTRHPFGGNSSRPRDDAPGAGGGLRLTLADVRLPFAAGRLLRRPSQRVRAAVWDTSSLLIVALGAFVVFDMFWMPLGIAALSYYVGGILLLDNTPGVCLFGPKPLNDHGGAGMDPAAQPKVLPSVQDAPAIHLVSPTTLAAPARPFPRERRHAPSERRHAPSERRHAHSERRHTHSERRHTEGAGARA